MMHRNFLMALVAILFSTASPAAFSSERYCSDQSTTYRVYFAPKFNMGETEKTSVKSALNNVFRELEVGDKLELFVASDDGVNRAFSSCFPGCPQEGMLSQFFGLGGGCKATLAKKHRLEFTNDYVSKIKNIMDASSAGSQGYKNILATLDSINIHAATLNDTRSSSTIVSSMYVAEKVDAAALDRFFVQSVQGNRMPERFPNLPVTGLPINSDLINLWEDLYRLRDQRFSYK